MRVRTSGRLGAAIGLGAMLALLLAVPAAARQYSRDGYDWTDSGSYECGEGNWVDWEAWGSGRLSIRTGTGDDQDAFFAHDSYTWGAVDTRRSDGARVTFAGHGNTKETKAVRVSGTIFEFTSVDAGQLVVRDDAGDVLVRDSGSIRETIRFDTLGDDKPGGDFITSVSIRVNGPHTDFDTCSVFGE
jgi:hypothetical protein